MYSLIQAAPEAIELRFRPTAGTVIRYDADTTMRSTFASVVTIREETSRHDLRVLTAGAADSRVRVVVRETNVKVDGKPPAKPDRDVAEAMRGLGYEYDVRPNAQGKLVRVVGAERLQRLQGVNIAEALLAAESTPLQGLLLPEKPLQMGASWSHDADVGPSLGIGLPGQVPKLAMRWTLRAQEERNGVDCVRLELTASREVKVAAGQGGADAAEVLFSIEAEGTAWVSAQDGLVVESRTTLSAKARIGGRPFEVEQMSRLVRVRDNGTESALREGHYALGRRSV